MRKLTAASLTAAAFLSLGAGSALASPGESHHSKSVAPNVSRDRASHDVKADRSSRDHPSHTSRDASEGRR